MNQLSVGVIQPESPQKMLEFRYVYIVDSPLELILRVLITVVGDLIQSFAAKSRRRRW